MSWKDLETFLCKHLGKGKGGGYAPKNTERDKQICALRKTGLTYADLGANFGISGQRAGQICKKAGVAT